MAGHRERIEEVVDVVEGVDRVRHLVLYNDDYNTFDWVIRCLVEVCGHSLQQAEQLTYLVHFKGKATVKTGELSVLVPMKEALVDRGLSAVIQSD